MRCPKCRLILAEYNQSCPRCSYDLTELNQELGPFYEPNIEAFLEWFSLEENPLAETDSLGGLEEPALDLPETNDLLFGKESSASLDTEASQDTEPSILEDILGGEDEDLLAPDEPSLEAPSASQVDQQAGLLPDEEVPILDEVPTEENLVDTLESKDLEEIEDIGEIEEVDIDQVLDQDSSVTSEGHLDEIPDLEELLPPELQEVQKKEGQS